MKTIESLLTYQNPIVRQLIKEILNLGYGNIEVKTTILNCCFTIGQFRIRIPTFSNLICVSKVKKYNQFSAIKYSKTGQNLFFSNAFGSTPIGPVSFMGVATFYISTPKHIIKFLGFLQRIN